MTPPDHEAEGLDLARRIVDWFDRAGALDPGVVPLLRRELDDTAPGEDARMLLLAHPTIPAERLIEATLDLEGADEWVCPGYALTERLGEGGAAVVYRAMRLDAPAQDHGPVAVKLLREGVLDDPSVPSRLARELDVARRLSHPGLPWYGELGTSRAGTPFVTMQLLDGQSLLDRMGPSRTPLSESELWALLGRLADVLAHLAEHGVVHRDVKPHNILLADDPAQAFLCDLGLAFAPGRDASLTRFGEVIGTPHFMSPEHAHGERRLTSAADVYSLGATLYFAATGELPFDARQALDILELHQNEPLTPIRVHDPELSEALDALVTRMMAKAPDDRPSPAELRDARP